MNSQCKRLESMMKRKWVTPMDALKIGCMRLAARVHDLRASGVQIESEMVYKGDTKYKRYRVKK